MMAAAASCTQGDEVDHHWSGRVHLLPPGEQQGLWLAYTLHPCCLARLIPVHGGGILCSAPGH
jgi:hypothetical protein